MKRLIIYLILLIVLSSCVTDKYYNSKVSPNEVQSMLFFPSYSYICYITKNNECVINDSLSKKSSDIINKSNNYTTNLKKYIELDSVNYSKIEEEVNTIIKRINYEKNVENLPYSQLYLIDSILKSQNQRFGLFTVLSGMKRSNENYGSKMAFGIATSLFLGVGYIPTKSITNIEIIIYDNYVKEVIYYGRNNQIKSEFACDNEEKLIKINDNIIQEFFSR